MQVLANHLRHLPVMSFQTGEAIAQIQDLIIDPSNLGLIAFHCLNLDRQSTVLLVRDIRRFTSQHLIIDSEDDLADPRDIVRLAKLTSSRFNLLRKLVVSDLGRRLGHVNNYAINLDTNQVQKLHIVRPGLRAWFSPELVIDRGQIIDVTPQRITVRDTTSPAPVLPTEAVPSSPA